MRVVRERTQLLKERTRHVNRIRALLNLQGVREVRGFWGGDWRQWLDQVMTGDGRPLGTYLQRELSRQFSNVSSADNSNAWSC